MGRKKARDIIKEAIEEKEKEKKEQAPPPPPPPPPEEETSVQKEREKEAVVEVEVSRKLDEESMMEIVRKASTDVEEARIFQEKLARFLSLPEEERRRRVLKLIEYLASLFRTKSEVEAGIAALELLAKKPEALIYFSYMWKPQYREMVLGLLYYVAEAGRRLGLQL